MSGTAHGRRPGTHTARRAMWARLAAATLTVGLALAGCSNGTTVGGEKDGKYTDASGAITVISAERRGDPVELSAETLEGTSFDVASMRGNPAVLNVWYSTCVPCRKEAPDLVAAHDELAPTGVRFLGLNIKQGGGDPEALAFQRAFKIPYPSLADDGGKTLLALRGEVSPNVIPSTLVLDSEGRVAARIMGQTTKNTLLGVVEAVRSGTVYVGPSSAPSGSAGATP